MLARQKVIQPVEAEAREQDTWGCRRLQERDSCYPGSMSRERALIGMGGECHMELLAAYINTFPEPLHHDIRDMAEATVESFYCHQRLLQPDSYFYSSDRFRFRASVKPLHVVERGRFCDGGGGIAGSLRTSSLKSGGLSMRAAEIPPSHDLPAHVASASYSRLKRRVADRFSLLRVLGHSGFPPRRFSCSRRRGREVGECATRDQTSSMRVVLASGWSSEKRLGYGHRVGHGGRLGEDVSSCHSTFWEGNMSYQRRCSRRPDVETAPLRK